MALSGDYIRLRERDDNYHESQYWVRFIEGRNLERNRVSFWRNRVSLLAIIGIFVLFLGTVRMAWNRGTLKFSIEGENSEFSLLKKLHTCVPLKVKIPSLDEMTLEEKIGQMTQVDKNALEDDLDIAKYFLGSALSGGGGSPYWGNHAVDWADMVDHYQALTNLTRLRIPFIYGIDAVHGHNNVWGSTIFPHHLGLGASRNPDLVTAISTAAAREVAATGIRWAFSPAVSVCRDPRWGRCYESFSEETSVVQMMTSEINGWQSKPMDSNDPAFPIPGEVLVAATAKHFVGDGGTKGGVDEGNTILSEEELRTVHLPPYYDAIARGVMAVMVSYSSWNSLKMHGNHYLVNKVLKGELGFEGVVVSDWAAIQQLPGDWAEQVRSSVNTGIDMVMVPTTYKEFVSTLKQEVLAGRVAMSRIDDAVRRILKMKASLGLFENACAPRQLLDSVGSAAHRAVARQAVRETLVLLKNERREELSTGKSMFPLPMTPTTRILVAGAHANNIGLQCGGWTIEWQGVSGNITVGTTILEGIRNVANGTPGASVTYVEQPEGTEVADYGIIVVGETPYAEYVGDDQALQLDSSAHAAVYDVCKRMPCIVVIISGRPVKINHFLPEVDAVVAAWLPGSEGDGVADVLFGPYDFGGRLPITWFPDTLQLPMTSGNQPYTPLFPFGHGLNKNGDLLSTDM